MGQPDEAVPLGSIFTDCADMAFGPKVTVALVTAANGAAGAVSLFGNDFFVAAAGFGDNIPNIPKLVAFGIWAPLQILAIVATTDINVFVNCHEGVHQTVFEEHDAAMLLRTTLISSTLTAHDLNLTNRADRIDTFNSVFRTLTLRLALEKDLLRKGDARVSLFQVPESVCVPGMLPADKHQSCGQLELARDFVADTIRMNREAGLDVSQAQLAYDDGELQRGQGHYKEAYTRYRHAYVLAVRSQAPRAYSWQQ